MTNRVTLASVERTISALRPGPGRRKARLANLVHERAPEYERTESAPEMRVLAAELHARRRRLMLVVVGLAVLGVQPR